MATLIFSSTSFFLLIFCFIIILILEPRAILFVDAASRWQLLQRSVGLSAMHMQLLNNDRVVMFDRTDFGPSNINLPAGKCRRDATELALKLDCTAHSVEYDVLKNTVRPLTIQTDVWCSSGAVLPDGRLLQTGGFSDGAQKIRLFKPCPNCDWQETDGLAATRWYATNQVLPDGRVIIFGGRAQFNFEFYPKPATTQPAFNFPFLAKTNDQGIENNLYPFIFLHPDGNLFVFANNRAILFDYTGNRVVKTYPAMPDGNPRNYPSTGSAVLLPLKNLQQAVVDAEVLVCGGAPTGSFVQALNGKFSTALNTCGRIRTNDPNPRWVMETMPHPRVLGDMTLLPNGDVLIINGASAGVAGWDFGRNPVLNPDLYKPYNPVGARFQTQNPTGIPRMYHSAAMLLRDGRVLVGGSNPHQYYNFTGVPYPTELSLEAFYPPYLDAKFEPIRPRILKPRSRVKITYNQMLNIEVGVKGRFVGKEAYATMVAPSFATHSFSMNQRILVLENTISNGGGAVDGRMVMKVKTPPSKNLAPPGYYLLFAVHQAIPSEGIWVHLQ